MLCFFLNIQFKFKAYIRFLVIMLTVTNEESLIRLRDMKLTFLKSMQKGNVADGLE